MGSLKLRHDWVTSLALFTFMPWRRKWQPTPVFLSGIPGTGEPGGLPSMGSHRVGHEWSDLAAATAALICISLSRHTQNTQMLRLPSVGLHRVGHKWRDLAAAAALTNVNQFEIMLLEIKCHTFFLVVEKPPREQEHEYWDTSFGKEMSIVHRRECWCPGVWRGRALCRMALLTKAMTWGPPPLWDTVCLLYHF